MISLVIDNCVIGCYFKNIFTKNNYNNFKFSN